MKEFRSYPKPEPKPKKKFDKWYWAAIRKKSMDKKVKNQAVSKEEYNDFCRELWGEREHISELSGTLLPEYDFHSPKFCNLIRFHMHHIKKKSRYPELMLNKKNILFVTYDEHQIIEFGSDKQREQIGYTKFIQNQ